VAALVRSRARGVELTKCFMLSLRLFRVSIITVSKNMLLLIAVTNSVLGNLGDYWGSGPKKTWGSLE